MGSYKVTQNGSINIDLQLDFTDNGWSIVDGYAVHSGCNSGDIKATNIPTVIGKTYTLSFDVLDWTSGLLRPKVGGVVGADIVANGSYTRSFTAIDTSGVSLFSDGNLKVGIFKVSDGQVAGKTIAFTEKENKWVQYHSFVPENMAKFLDKFLTFNNGKMWIHNQNEIRNSYYGVKYPSVITFVANVEYNEEKDFFSFYINGNKPWGVEVTTPAKEGKSLGQKSRIKKGNFKLFKGRYVADFLRDMNDVRYPTEIERLMKGASLQGKLMEVTMTIDSDGIVELLSVEVECSPK